MGDVCVCVCVCVIFVSVRDDVDVVCCSAVIMDVAASSFHRCAYDTCKGAYTEYGAGIEQ